MRGPGIEPATVVDEIILNVDLAPTFLAIAGVPTPVHMDGRSFLPLLSRNRNVKDRWPDTFLIESSGRREPPHSEHNHNHHHNHHHHNHHHSESRRKNSHLTKLPNSTTQNIKERVLNETTDVISSTTMTTDESTGIDFGSHEHDDDDDDEDDSKFFFLIS